MVLNTKITCAEYDTSTPIVGRGSIRTGRKSIITDDSIVKNSGETLMMQRPNAVLLAPNGKPSNLSEYLYNLVRTPNFKQWFGDFELAAKYRAIKAFKPIVVNQKAVSYNEAENAYKQIDTVQNSIDGREIKFVRSIFVKIAAHKGHELMLHLIPQLDSITQTARRPSKRSLARSSSRDSRRFCFYTRSRESAGQYRTGC